MTIQPFSSVIMTLVFCDFSDQNLCRFATQFQYTVAGLCKILFKLLPDSILMSIYWKEYYFFLRKWTKEGYFRSFLDGRAEWSWLRCESLTREQLCFGVTRTVTQKMMVFMWLCLWPQHSDLKAEPSSLKKHCWASQRKIN